VSDGFPNVVLRVFQANVVLRVFHVPRRAQSIPGISSCSEYSRHLVVLRVFQAPRRAQSNFLVRGQNNVPNSTWAGVRTRGALAPIHEHGGGQGGGQGGQGGQKLGGKNFGILDGWRYGKCPPRYLHAGKLEIKAWN
jgi:hypothetical protein